MGDDYWKPTAEAFEQLFSKPKMTEKLLTRPPFRYIHDIFTSTLAATGFGEGMYGDDELDAKSIKDKDSKVNFLEKLIALVQMAAGEEIPVKSTKIVAGQEADQTNIFLQYLFKVATSGVDSAPIVAQIIGGGEEEQEAPEEDDADEEDAMRDAKEEEMKKQKRAAKKKQMEEEKQRQAEEDEEQRAQQEEAERQAREQEAEMTRQRKAKKKQKKEEPEPEPENNIIEDGQDDEDDNNMIVGDDDNDVGGDIDINEVDPESKFGRQAMAQLRAQEEEDEANRAANDDAGASGIKMGKIGRRGKKKVNAVERSEPQKKSMMSDAPKRTFGGYSEDDIEFMKKSIQALCQATNPLGKSIDFVTEDIDSMVKEYEYWKLDYSESQTKLAEQQRITEQTIQPLQDVTLAQLEEKIREEKSKIQNIRSQIIRNDNTIQNLLQSVISSG